jgi:hypothetical protein
MRAHKLGKRLSTKHRRKIQHALMKQNRPGKCVIQISLSGEHLQTFPSLNAAARFLRETTGYIRAAPSEIRIACKDKSHTRYGHRWSFSDG